MKPASCRWIPWALIGGLGVVVAANGTMIWFAARSFPGAIESGYEIGTGYNRVLDAAKRQAELGWTLRAAVEKDAILLSLTDATGRPLDGLAVEGVATRPVGSAAAHPLAFTADGAGRYRAAASDLGEGQWTVTLEAKTGAEHFLASRRILLP